MTSDEIDSLLAPLRDVLSRVEETPTLIICEHDSAGWSIALDDLDDLATRNGYWPVHAAQFTEAGN